MVKKIIIGLFVMSILTPFLTFGLPPILPTPGGANQVNISNTTNIVAIIERVFNFLFTILMFLAGIFLVYAGYVYLTAAGDAEKVTQAKNIIIYAVVAIIIGMVAWSIPTLINYVLLN